LLDDRRIRIRIHTSWLMDPDPGRPKKGNPDSEHWFLLQLLTELMELLSEDY
jgi:hypothetical protein